MILGIDASRGIRKKKTGVEWYSWHLLHAMHEMTPPDWRVDLYIPTNYELGELRITNENWKLKALNWPLRYFWTQGRLSWEMFRRPPDVLFVPSHVLPISHPPKTVVTIHDLGFERFPEAYKQTDLWYLHWSTKFAVKNASHIIVPSEFTKKELIELFKTPEEKITVIPHGVDFEYWSKVPASSELRNMREKYGLQKSYCVFFGRLEEKKNIRRLVGAWQIAGLDKIDLFLAGSTLNYKECANSNIKTPGFAPRDDLQVLLHGAKALISPSLYEGFGLPLLEAMVAGVPILASDIPTHREVAGEAVLFVDPFSIGAITEGVKKIINDEPLRQDLIAKGKERVKEFSWQKSAQKTWRVIQSISK